MDNFGHKQLFFAQHAKVILGQREAAFYREVSRPERCDHTSLCLQFEILKVDLKFGKATLIWQFPGASSLYDYIS